MSHGPDLNPIIDSTITPVPKPVIWGGIGAALAGVVGAFLVASQWPERAMADFLQNTVFWMGVAQGGFMVSVAFTLTKARWGRALKRIAEAFGFMMPVLYAALLVFLAFGGMEIFPWMHEDLPAHKKIYLTEPFFWWRQVGGLGLLLFFNYKYTRASWRPDLGMMKERLGDSAPGWYNWFTKDWKGLEAEVEISETQQRKWAAITAVTYSLVFSFVAVDLSMSLSPHWFANMFPAWFFMSSVWSGLVAIAIFSLLAGRHLKMDHLLTPSLYHDLGKLIFAFCMFWGYTTFAMFLAIWYGNMTEETGFILLRTQLDPWADVSKMVVLTCFLIPWTLLLSRSMKKIRTSFLTVACLIFVGIWTERFLVMIPSVWMESTLPIGLGDLLIPVGFGGVMVLVVTWVLSNIPAVPITDKMYAENDLEVHVHPSHGHAAK